MGTDSKVMKAWGGLEGVNGGGSSGGGCDTFNNKEKRSLKEKCIETSPRLGQGSLQKGQRSLGVVCVCVGGRGGYWDGKVVLLPPANLLNCVFFKHSQLIMC